MKLITLRSERVNALLIICFHVSEIKTLATVSVLYVLLALQGILCHTYVAKWVTVHYDVGCRVSLDYAGLRKTQGTDDRFLRQKYVRHINNMKENLWNQIGIHT